MVNDDERADATSKLEGFYEHILQEPKRETHVNPLGYMRWLPEYDRARAKGMSHTVAVAHMLNEVRKVAGIPPAEPTPTPTPPPPDQPRQGLAPIHGYLRDGARQTFADDTGPRIVGVCSWFPALRILRDDPDEARRQMDRIVGRWQGARIFWHLGDPWWTKRDLGVDPGWHNFDGLLRTFLEEMWARELRVSISCGDMQYIPSRDHEALYQRMAEICRSVNSQVVCLSGMVNEARVNSSEGENWHYWAGLSRLWQNIYPWGHHGLSDPGDQEEPFGLVACSREPATVALLHGTRHSPQDATRRAFNVRYEGTFNPTHGQPRITQPIVQDEPTGTGEDVYQPVDDRHWLFAIYTMHVLTGQMTTFFGGAALRNRRPLDSDWGFVELPKLWRVLGLPEDVGTWTPIPGHKMSAPVGARSYENDGEGPHRVDQVATEAACYAIAYGGRGRWQLFSRLWDADFRVVSADGVLAHGYVRKGETLPVDLHSGHRAVVVELRRR